MTTDAKIRDSETRLLYATARGLGKLPNGFGFRAKGLPAAQLLDRLQCCVHQVDLGQHLEVDLGSQNHI